MRCDCGSTRFVCERCGRVHETREQDLTARQREVLSFMRQHFRDSQAPVRTRTIADQLAITISTVRDHMRPLQRAGLIYHPYDEMGRTKLNSGWIPRPSEDKVIPLYQVSRHPRSA